jgi:hypothetical protein
VWRGCARTAAHSGGVSRPGLSSSRLDKES